MKKKEKPTKKKIIITSFTAALIVIILLSSITPIATEYLNKLYRLKDEKEQNIENSYNPEFDDFLYVNNVDETEYNFNAKGECYILVDINNNDFTYFNLDGQTHLLSYGYNIIPIEFSEDLSSHIIEIMPTQLQYFESLTVEPLILAEDSIETKLDQDTEISFVASGSISILTRPKFAYNWLYVELINDKDESIIIKRIHDTQSYPEIDPMIYCLFIEQGTYIRYDINLELGNYRLIFRGDGLLEYKVVVNFDWDQDNIVDVDEIQKGDLYDFELNPTVPDIWGFFEKSHENLLLEENSFYEGYFSFYIPESYINNDLTLNFQSGKFKEVVVDGDSLFLMDQIFESNRHSPAESVDWYEELQPGWHHIKYAYSMSDTEVPDIKFLVNNENIKIMKISEFIDTDGDGIKDIEENSNGLNPAKVDSDEDGIPDNLDNSPLSKLNLEANEINQIILPTNYLNNSLISLQIKKPTDDYSTNGVPRLWRSTLNVSIYPVLRMFGNKKQIDEHTKVNMNRQTLEDTWGKDVRLIYNPGNYNNEGGVGDPLPNPSDPDSEFFFIFPKPAEESLGYHINIPRLHASKLSGFLDLRFDFIWLITTYNATSGETSILHYYDFEESILVQSMTMQEISNVRYTLGSPDCFVENQILWALTQNPTLTLETPAGFDISDDIIGQGNVDYFGLPEATLQDRGNPPIGESETEVLYVAGLFKNCDILNKINIKKLADPDFLLVYQGDYETYLSYYSISNIYYDQNYFIGDSEIQGENKVHIQVFFSDFSDNGVENVQKRANIMGLPIALRLKQFSNSKVLEITQAQGSNVGLNDIPYSENTQLDDKINLLHQTFILRDTQSLGTPLINFQNDHDIYKEFLNNRQEDAELSNLFFTPQPLMPAEVFQDLVSQFWDRIESFDSTLETFQDYVNTAPLPQERIDLQEINSMLDRIETLRQHFLSELYDYTEFLAFSQDFYKDFWDLMDLYNDPESDHHLPESWAPTIDPPYFNTFKDITKYFKEFTIDICKIFFKKLSATTTKIFLNQIDPARCGTLQNVAHQQHYQCQLIVEKRNIQLKARAAGAVTVALGGIILIFGIVELFLLESEKQKGIYDNNQRAYAKRMAGAISNTIIGVLTITQGILLIYSSFKGVIGASVKTALKWLGIATTILSVIVVVFDWVSFFASGEITPNNFQIELTKLIVNSIALGIGIGIMISSAPTIVGIAVGAVIAALGWLTSWLTPLLNHPHIKFISDSGFYYSAETLLNIRRNGGLEVGDIIRYRLHIDNDGDTKLWMRARFRIGGYGWIGGYRWIGGYDGWKGWLYITEYDEYDRTFAAEILYPTPDLFYQLDFQLDWEKYEIILVVPTWERVEGARDEIIDSMNMPALEQSVSSFYANTLEILSFDRYNEQFQQAVGEYKYNDAYKIANNFIRLIEQRAGITLNEFDSIFARLEQYQYNNDFFMLKTASILEYTNLILRYWWQGFRGRATIHSLIPYIYDLISYIPSNGYLVIPKIWIYIKQIELEDAYKFRNLRNNLPLRTNIRTNLRNKIIDLNPISGSVDVNLNFYLSGPDRPNVDIELTPPEGFSINPQIMISQPISSTFTFTLTRDNPEIGAGINYFDLKLVLNSEVIYQEAVRFTIKSVGSFELETQSPTLPITPGDSFHAVNVINSGTTIGNVEFIVEGIPENFICKELNPEAWLGNSQFFTIYPGESRESLIIKPPRHYTTIPGTYTYSIIAKDFIYNNFYIMHTDSFEVGEFYDMSFQCENPQITILDCETAIYTFEIKNLGNTPQQFTITSDELNVAIKDIDKEIVDLNPGESELVTLTLTPTEIGNQEFSIYANSEYNSGVIQAYISIIDDDTTPPEIQINYEGGDGTDGNSGYFAWIITDDCDNIGGDYDTGFSEIKIKVYYESSEGLPDGEIIISSSESGSWNLPAYLGTYTITILATDNDDDRIEDSLTTELVEVQEIIDDDSNPPELFNLNITHDIHNVNASFEATDQSGIEDIIILVNGDVVAPTSLSQDGNIYTFTLSNQWILKKDIYNMEIQVVDSDNDRPNDSLNSSISGTFEISLEDMYNYVDWQLEELKAYIDKNLCRFLRWILIRKLNQAQKHLQEAYCLAENDKITCGLFHDVIAKILLRTTEFKIEIFKKFNFIEDEHAEYIRNSTRIIRDNIVLLMGATVGREIGYAIALIEVQLLNLNDFIEKELNWWNGICVKNHISSATRYLESAIIKLSMDRNVDCLLSLAQWKLELAMNQVNRLLNRGKMSQELAELLLPQIQNIQSEIAMISNSQY